MGDYDEPLFYELNHESKMLLVKTHSHASQRPSDEARTTRRKAIEGNADPIIRQATDQNSAAYRRCGGGGGKRKSTTARQTTEEGAMARKTIVERLPRTVSVG